MTGFVISTRKRYFLCLAGILSLFLLIVCLAPLVGPVSMNLHEALSGRSRLDWEILFRARLPRILFAALSGGALASSGVVFQAILKNPLASPFTLGVSGGGSLGASLAILAGWSGAALGALSLPLCSFLGSLAVVLLVYALSRTSGGLSTLTLLLAGVVLNYICASLVLLIHYFSDFGRSLILVRWIMGSVEILDYSVFLTLAPFLLPGLILLFYLSRFLNVLSAGQEWAASRGVNVDRLLRLSYFGASLVTGSIIAFSGPIGFVGLIVPHLLRLLLGADHRLLFPAAFLAGGTFLVLCDTVARTLFSPAEIPVGILTSLLGGPLFLWLLLKQRKDTCDWESL